MLRKGKRRLLLVLMVLFLFNSLMVWTAARATEVAATEPSERIVLPLTEGRIRSLDPRISVARQDAHVAKALFDCVFYRDPENNLHLGLAESWRAIDPYTLEITFKQGIKYHNGMEVTAEDLKFSIETAKDPELQAGRAGEVAAVKMVEVLDKYTARIHFHYPDPVFMQRLADWPIIPKEYIENHGWEHFWDNPIGTGPYKFVDWRKGERLTLTANEDYWKGVPDIKEVVFRVLPDPGTRVAELLTGGLNVDPVLRPDDIRRLEESPRVDVLKVPGLRNAYMYLSDANIPESPLYDVRVRQALAHSIDVDTIIDTVLVGDGIKLNAGGLNPFHDFFDNQIPYWEYNPDLSRKLLAEAGYPEGRGLPEFQVIVATVPLPKSQEVMEAVAMQAAEVGIKLDLVIFHEVSGWVDYMAAGRGRPIYFNSWGSFGIPDPHMILLYYFGEGEDLRNYAATSEMERLIAQGAATLDREERDRIYKEFQRLSYEECIWIPLHAMVQAIAVDSRIEYTPRADEYLYVFEMRWK